MDDFARPLQRALRASAEARLSVVADTVTGDIRPDTAERLESVVADARSIAQHAYDRTRHSPMPIHVLAVVVAALMKEVSDDPLYMEMRADLIRIANVIGSASLGDVILDDY